MKLGEFFVQLGVSADTLKVKDFASAIGEIPVEAASAILAVAGITLKLKEMIGEAFDAATAMEEFQTATGLSAQEMGRWQIVAQQANVSAEAITSSVQGLSRQLAEIRLGRGNIAPFQLLGIDTTKNAFGVLDQLRTKIKGLDRPTAVNLISQMGLNPETLNLLTLTDEKFQEFTNTAHGMSEEQQASFLKVKLGAIQLGLVLRDIVYNIMGNFIAVFEKSKIAVYALAGALAVLAVAFGPISLAAYGITAAVAALILIFEDLAVYFMGGKSLTGVAIEGLKKLGELTFDKTASSLQHLDKVISGSSFVKGMTDFALKSGLVTQVPQSAYNVHTMADGRVIVQRNQVDIHVNESHSPSETARENKKAFDQAVSDAALQTDTQGH